MFVQFIVYCVEVEITKEEQVADVAETVQLLDAKVEGLATTHVVVPT